MLVCTYHYVNFYQAESMDELEVGREDKVSKNNLLRIDVNIIIYIYHESSPLYCLCQQPYDPSK